jgi:hypothetical protein
VRYTNVSAASGIPHAYALLLVCTVSVDNRSGLVPGHLGMCLHAYILRCSAFAVDLLGVCRSLSLVLCR